MRKIGDGEYMFTTLEKHFLSVGDKAKLYDKIRDKYYDLVAVSGNADNYNVFSCKVYDEGTENGVDITFLLANGNERSIDYLSSRVSNDYVSIYDFKLFKMDNLGIPSYASIIRDGTCGLVWREVLNNGFGKDDTVEEYPFTNGSFYVSKKIDIYVRRQDPYDYYGLYSDEDIFGNAVDTSVEDNYIKEDDIEC